VISNPGTAASTFWPRLQRRLRVRWWMFGFMFAFAFIAYVQRQSVTVAAADMPKSLGFSQMQIGGLSWAFVTGYTCLQFAGGIYGQRVGARRAFILISLVAYAAVVATPLAPALFSGSVMFAVMLLAQLVLGCAQAPVFPVSAGVLESWFPAARWSLVLGVQALGMNLGAAIAPPLISQLMVATGWREALLLASLPALVLIAAWAWYGRNSPREHPGVSAAELAELGPRREDPAATSIDWKRVRKLLGDRNVQLITLSYTLMNYVFYLLQTWCFLYLIQERHFTMLESGWLAMGPPLGAALGCGVGGKLGGMCYERFGARWGYRWVPLIGVPLGGLFLIAAVEVSSAYWAVAALSAAYAAVELLEGPSWAAMLNVAQSDTMAATGVLNTGANAAGVIGIPIVAYLSGHGMWTAAFVIGALLAVVSGVLWLWIDADRRFDPAGASSP
jgi:MFS transporter, ACS family, glucarate transporter